MTVADTTRPSPASDRLLHALPRFESLGRDCEFGFVLNALDYRKGQYFRWILGDWESLLTVVQNDFEGSFQRENLVVAPQNDLMILDQATGASYHSGPIADDAGKPLHWKDGPEAQHRIYESERGKHHYLIRMFREGMAQSDRCYVLKVNNCIGDRAQPWVDALRLGRPGERRRLVVVAEADEAHPAGEIVKVMPGVYNARIRHFGSPNVAHPVMEDWVPVLERMLDLD